MMRPEHDRSSHPAHRVTTQLMVGLFVIAFGLLMTFDNLGLVRAEQYMQFWPGGVVAVGLLKLWQSRDGGGGIFGGVIFTTVGTWLLLEQTAVVDLSLWQLWPALLVMAGGFLVWQGLAGPRPRPISQDSSLFSVIAVLGGVSRGSNSPDFRGGDLTAVLGGCEIDLRQAAIDGEAVLDVFALCGGIDMRVPENWTVESRVVPILGGVEDNTRPLQSAGRQRLVIRGFVIMGGIEIKN